MKNKLNLLVVMALAITTILLGKAMPVYAATETRTTVSRSYVDFWEYNNRPGWFRVEGADTSEDVQLGHTVSYGTNQPYYRGLQPGEKVKSVRVMSGTIGNVTQARFTNSQYDEFNNKTWGEFSREQEYAPTSTIVNMGSVSGGGSHPSASVRIGTKLTSKSAAYKLPNEGHPDANDGYRVYATYVIEWEIELAPSDDVLVTIQHYDEKTNRPLTPDTSRRVKKGTTVSESSRSFTRMKYTYSEISDNGGSTWKLRNTASTRSINVDKNTIIRFYYKDDGTGGGTPGGNIKAICLKSAETSIIDGSSKSNAWGLNIIPVIIK